MIPFPTSLSEARGAFAAIKAVTDTFGPLKDHERINPSQAVYANRSGGEPGAMLCNRDSNGQADWHMTIWFDSGDFELWNDAGGRWVTTDVKLHHWAQAIAAGSLRMVPKRRAA